MHPQYYHLLATVGLSPAVVLETIWRLATDPISPKTPSAITILTTGSGYVTWTQKMIQTGIWKQMCHDLLDGADLKPEVHLVTDELGRPVDDLHHPKHNMTMANTCYALAYRLTRTGQLPLVGSMAGGQSIMSVHLFSAFSLFARQEDQLVHVAAPSSASNTEASLNEVFRKDIQYAEVPFLPFAGYLRKSLMQKIKGDSLNMKTLVQALKQYDFATPTQARIVLGRGKWLASIVELCDTQENVQAHCHLSPLNLATLIVLAQNIHPEAGFVKSEALLTPLVQKQFKTLATLYRPGHTGWQDNTDVSSAISRLNKQLQKSLPAHAYLQISGYRHDGDWVYRWAADSAPQLEVQASTDTLRRLPPAKWKNLYPKIPYQEIMC